MIGTLLPSTSSSSESSSARDPQESWNAETLVISQKHVVQGVQSIFANANAIRIEGNRSGVSLIAKAPYWQVYVCDFSTKTFYRTTVSAFRNQVNYASWRYAEQASSVAVIKQPLTRSFAGKICNQWSSGITFGSDTKKQPRQELAPEAVPEAIELWVLQKKFAAVQLELISRFYELPLVTGVPLHAASKSKDGYVKNILETSTCKIQSLPVSFFEPPQTYSEVCKEELSRN